MYLWQRLAAVSWWMANEDRVRQDAATDLAITEQPGKKRLTIEIACDSQTRATNFRRRFGGRVIKLRADWLNEFARAHRTKPLRVGERLVITNAEVRLPSRPGGSDPLVIPAGAAFGTGQHATTAMSLRLLEQLTRTWKPGWSMLDLGTGSGIFALAGKRLGAGTAVAVDNDPVAISTARGNAKLNRVRGVDFQIVDVRKWRMAAHVDVITANLFSELLIEVLPRLRRVSWLILSGVMRDQEREVMTALNRNGFHVVTVRRRGKWIAALAARS